MEKMNLEIEDYEVKETNAGKLYYRFKTNQGWMSCFDKTSNDELKKHKGRVVECSVEVTQKGDNEYTNIKKFLGISTKVEGDDTPVKEEAIVLVDGKNVGMSHVGNKNTTMYTSYAKDIFVASVEKVQGNLTVEDGYNLMKTSIEFVKQARDAFS